MTSTRRTTALILSVVGLLALPSLASASVGGQLSKASSALENALMAAGQHGDASAFATYMRAAHKHTAKAERAARKAKGKVRKAKRMRRVARQYDQNLNEYADLIESVPADVQVRVVRAVGISAEARGRVVEFLVRIAERLPEPARTAVLNAVAAFETDGDLAALFEAFASEDVAGSVKAMILEQIEMISGHIGGLLDRLGGLTGMLPPQAAGALEQAIGMIQSHIGELSTLLDELLSGFGGDGGFFGGLGFGGFGSLCDLLGGLPIPLPICD